MELLDRRYYMSSSLSEISIISTSAAIVSRTWRSIARAFATKKLSKKASHLSMISRIINYEASIWKNFIVKNANRNAAMICTVFWPPNSKSNRMATIEGIICQRCKFKLLSRSIAQNLPNCARKQYRKINSWTECLGPISRLNKVEIAVVPEYAVGSVSSTYITNWHVIHVYKNLKFFKESPHFCVSDQYLISKVLHIK